MNNWYRVVDEALVCAHLGVANEDDSYEEAKRNPSGLNTNKATQSLYNQFLSLAGMCG